MLGSDLSAMAASSLLTVCVLCAAAFRTGFGLNTVSAIYGETINIPCGQEITQDLLFGKWKYVGDCVAKDSYPDGNITWYRNGQDLLPVDGVVNVEWWKDKNSSSGLHSMRSTLQYMSTKEDIDAQFSCAVTYYMPEGLATMDSDPAGQEEGIHSSSAYHITDIKRNATGDYKCSLLNKIMIASTMVTVHYLDLSLTPSGDITKQVGDSLSVSCIPSASKNVSVTWMKNQKILAQPSFTNLQYRDSGVYECETSLMEVDGLRRKKTLRLTVEGKPRIKLSKKTNADGRSKTILYEVDGFPKPEVQCVRLGNDLYLNKTEETMLSNGKYSAKIIISPEENVTIICSAENKLGRESHSLNVSASDNNDHAKLIVGIVVGLLLAALVAGLAYWIYVKKSSSASKHVGKELGNTEENKKLEENNHKTEP
uniref:Ig-like domain-containing protein n=1 Tax=Pyxicephalus adspersus TaxID=30357 RepID=A0AAV3B6D7_PYXAD|nr:TPA: hypothetical protein GDO54_001021 [Pyxicephalus adspersus]